MNDASVRLDKWLWAARFFKTRSAATEAVNGGKVDVNGDRVKPARPVHPGDTVELRIPPYHYRVVVTGLGERRGSAAQAATLYQETADSLAERERLREQLRLAPASERGTGKPGKKDRRAWERLRGRS
ncbi:MAG TPA: RNA-binding S4 domain-containing protein [Gemmatimonadales bacterium]|jgi:ribosome-associated heat shock protein Hsp15